jgi:hypothetical protein
MSLIVTNVQEVEILTDFLTPALTMRLYGNDRTPAGGDVAADYTEIAGGGYAAKALTFANWGFTAGGPTVALYNAVQQWVFTGAINAPSTIYGYFITRDSDSLLLWAERFPSGSVPFTPIAGSVIRVTPRITAESA